MTTTQGAAMSATIRANKLAAALRAIRARVAGEFDNPELQAFGPLTDTTSDCAEIAYRALAADAAASVADDCGAAVEERPSRESAEAAITRFLADRFTSIPAFALAEDGDDGWSFWVTEDGCEDDTTSYVRSDLSVEWLGTAYADPEAAEAHEGCEAGIDTLRERAQAYNDALNAQGLAPNGDDYNHLLDIIAGHSRVPSAEGR